MKRVGSGELALGPRECEGLVVNELVRGASRSAADSAAGEFSRSVDLLTRDSVERSPNKYFRHFALRRTEPIYECA